MPPINFTTLDVIFEPVVVHALNGRIDLRPSIVFFFKRERYIYMADRSNDPEKYKSDQNLSKNKKGLTMKTFWACGSSTRLKFRIETRKIERSVAVVPLALITARYFAYRNRFFCHISWWVTNWALQLVSIVSLCLQDCLHQSSPWSGTMIFGAIMQICRPKMSPKIGNFEFSRISRRDGVGF